MDAMPNSRLETLLKFLEQDPGDSFTRYAIAMEYVSAGNIPKAVEYLEDLLLKDPGYIPAYQQLGYLYRDTGQTEQSRHVLHRGIQLARESGDMHAVSEMQDALDDLE